MNAKVWLISGSSRGIGRSIAGKALAMGDYVAACARNPRDAEDLQSSFPDLCSVFEQDMRSEIQIRKSVEAAMEKFGRIDVLVNNAGYGLQGMIEEVSMDQVRNQMETNFFGLVSLTQAVLPFMRKQESGFIANISSVAGLRGVAGFGIYNASKFAVEGLTEALAQEARQFNIKVCAVEPGPYRTDWAGNSLERSGAMRNLETGSPYFEINRKFKKMLDERSGKQPGDPEQIAEILFQYSRSETVPLHLLFGDIGITAWNERVEGMNEEWFMKKFPHDLWKI